MTSGTRKTGEFCWINMLTPRPVAAMELFRRVLGWTYFEMPGIGHGMRVGGCDVGGLFDLEGPNTPPGLEPIIGVMVKVENADEACGKVASLSGESKPAFDVAEQGRMAVCFDPIGAEFDVWEPKRMPGTDADSRLHGAPSWFENRTTDIGRATGFYSGLFGWTPEAIPMPGSTYTVFRREGVKVAGMMGITPEMTSPRPCWTTCFTVDDADEATREAVALGAMVRVGLLDIAGIGRCCGLASPQGVEFNVIQWTK